MVENDSIGSRLKIAMSARGMSITSLSSCSGISYQGVRKIVLAQTKNINASTCAMLATCLGVSPTWLGTGDGPMDPQRNAAAPSVAAVDEPTIGATILQLGSQLTTLSPMARASIAPLIARVVENPDLAAEAARTADAIARS